MILGKSAIPVLAGFLMLLLSIPAFALSMPELERLTAPVALYQDELLSQILSASTHPDEISEAAEYLRSQGGKVKEMPPYEWDSGVKALLYTPDILARLDDEKEWTEKLGKAVTEQLDDVMTAIQNLRKRAMKSKSFTDSEYQNVVVNNGNITIEQKKDPDKVYYPTYSSSDLLLGNALSLALTFAVAGLVSDWWRCSYFDWGWRSICYRPWYLTSYCYPPGGYYYRWYYMEDYYIYRSRSHHRGCRWYPPRRGFMPPPPRPYPGPPPPRGRRRHGNEYAYTPAPRNYVPIPSGMIRTPYYNPKAPSIRNGRVPAATVARPGLREIGRRTNDPRINIGGENRRASRPGGPGIRDAAGTRAINHGNYRHDGMTRPGKMRNRSNRFGNRDLATGNVRHGINNDGRRFRPGRMPGNNIGHGWNERTNDGRRFRHGNDSSFPRRTTGIRNGSGTVHPTTNRVREKIRTRPAGIERDMTRRSMSGGGSHRMTTGGSHHHRSMSGGGSHRMTTGWGSHHRTMSGGGSHRMTTGGTHHRTMSGGGSHRMTTGGSHHRSMSRGGSHHGSSGRHRR